MAFPNGTSWDETTPTDTTTAVLIDDHFLDIKKAIRSRMILEHEWPSSQSATSEAGQHKFITLQEQVAKPTIAGTQLAAVYVKTVGAGLQELFFEDESGNEVQIISGTQLNVDVAGHMIQQTSTFYTAVATGTNTTTLDDSIPQITEGDGFMSLAVTPLFATSNLRVSVLWNGAAANGVTVIGALYVGTTANALACVVDDIRAESTVTNMKLDFITVPGTTGALTYTFRVGSNQSTTVTMNGVAGARKLGGKLTSGMIISEIKV